jgi:predicted metal-binding membrane protein
MALLFVFGVMNVWAMLGLAVIVFSEKLLRPGETVGRPRRRDRSSCSRCSSLPRLE